MAEVTIICLIYKSKKLTDMIYKSLYAHTPMLNDGSAELLFVANDPTNSLVEYLENKKYPYIINCNKVLTLKELKKEGYAEPEYIRRVYQGYNKGILSAKTKRIVLINSDNFFSDDWLENLFKYSEYKNIVCSTLVEPGHEKHNVFPGAIQANFGRTTEDYDDDAFQAFANKIRKTGLKCNGAYMPCLLYKDPAILAGLYPEGNILDKKTGGVKVYGDEYFYSKLNDFGLNHVTALDSIVYHLKEGELDESCENEKLYVNKVKYKSISFPKVDSKDLIVNLKPELNHSNILMKLQSKVLVIISYFASKESLIGQIEGFLSQTYKNIEIIVVFDYTHKFIGNIIEKYSKSIKFIENTFEDFGTKLFYIISDTTASYLILSREELIGIYTEKLIETMMLQYSNELELKKLCCFNAKAEDNNLKLTFVDIGKCLFPMDFVSLNLPNILKKLILIEPILFNINEYKGKYKLVKINEDVISNLSENIIKKTLLQKTKRKLNNVIKRVFNKLKKVINI